MLARRHAPPVAVTCSGGGAWRAVQLLLAALAAAVPAAWAALHAGFAEPIAAAAAAAAAVAAAWLVWRLTRTQACTLSWNGEHWAADGQAGEVDVMLDLGGWLLLRLRPLAGRARWLPVPDSQAGPARHGLRAALYSRTAPGLPAPEPQRH